jgi:hypothetical protein
MIDIDQQYPSDYHTNHTKIQEWHSCSIRQFVGPDRHTILQWLKTTDGGRFWEGGTRVWFEREEDMMLFTLTWC